MEKRNDNKPAKRKSRRAILTAVVMAALLCFAAFKMTDSVSGQILQSNISAMEEIALHDRQSIKNSLDIRWSELERIAAQLRRQSFSDDADISDKLRNMVENVTSADFLMLVTDDATEYRSTGLIRYNSELSEILKGRDARFVSRYNEELSKWKEDHKEMLVMGVPVDLAGPGVHFQWLICRLSISTLERELKIDSYQGEGFSSVIDAEGNYIVNISRNHSIGMYDNFFSDLSSAVFPGYNSAGEAYANIFSGGTNSIVYTAADGQENIMLITDMDFIDWHFITTVPMKVFRTQATSLMSSFLTLLAVVVIVFAVALLLIARQGKQNELLKLAEAENRAKTSFLFNMSHDIRTPMNAILGFTDIALNHIGEEARVADSLTKIKNSGSLLLGLINDILEMSRIEAGMLDITEDPVDMAHIGDNINPMIMSLAAAKNIQYGYSVDRVTDRHIYADIQLMSRFLVNLLTNAVKYTNRGGKVFFTIEQEGTAENGAAAYRFLIADTGVGMSQAFIENSLYQQFSREKTSTLSKQQGTGLGLAITKKIVDALGGKIEVESKVGKGTTFTVTLTFRLQSKEDMEKAGKASVGTEEPSRALTLAGKRVLVVEDNELNREISTVILEEAGISVDAVEDGSAALDALRKKGIAYYDFVLMDIQMPVMDGYEATRRIRQLPEGDKVRIIAISANAFAEDKKKSEEAGMDDHIAKPVDLNELMRTLRKHA